MKGIVEERDLERERRPMGSLLCSNVYWRYHEAGFLLEELGERMFFRRESLPAAERQKESRPQSRPAARR